MSKANFNIAKAITLLSEVISADAALIPPRTLDVFGNEVDAEEEEQETVPASEFTAQVNEAEEFSNDITDTLDLLKEEIDQILEDQTVDDQLDDEFSQSAWNPMEDDVDDDDDDHAADSDADENADDDDAVQEELALGDNTDDAAETPLTREEDFDKMIAAYTQLEQRSADMALGLESVLESISGLLEDTDTFRNGLDRTWLDRT